MTLVVIGDNAERSLPVAAVAALTSGERVLFTTEHGPGEHTVQVEGTGLSGTAVIEAVAPDAQFDGDSYVIAAPAKDLEALLSVRPEQFAGKLVLLGPGGFGGALLATELFRNWGIEAPIFGEVPGWIAGGSLSGDRVNIAMRKRNLDIAGTTDEHTAALLDHFSRYLPELVAADFLTTSLSNINATIHPPLAILNATRIENGEDWHYWDEGLTPGVARLMDAIDAERVNVVTALGGNPRTLLGGALNSYGGDGMQGDTFFDAVKVFPLYRNRLGPKQLDSRFLTDDVPYGIAAYEQLAERIGVDHEALTAVRVLSEVILGRELKADAAAVESLVQYASERSFAGSK